MQLVLGYTTLLFGGRDGRRTEFVSSWGRSIGSSCSDRFLHQGLEVRRYDFFRNAFFIMVYVVSFLGHLGILKSHITDPLSALGFAKVDLFFVGLGWNFVGWDDLDFSYFL